MTPMNFPADFIDDTDGFRNTMILESKHVVYCYLFIYLFIYEL